MDKYFEQKLKYNNISFRYAKGKSIAGGNEMHPYHEILYYIDGDATFMSEDYSEVLSNGTLVIIPKEAYHRFDIKNQQNYTRLVFSFADGDVISELIPSVMTGVAVVSNPDAKVTGLIEAMRETICSDIDDSRKKTWLYGAFLMLLAEISGFAESRASAHSRDTDSIVYKAIRYIDQKYTSDISADEIANHVNASVSGLYHCFKKEMGISLYRYITEKRLIYAHKLIEQNNMPTKIYTQCGFNDYSCFYKAFVKMFGYSPRDTK